MGAPVLFPDSGEGMDRDPGTVGGSDRILVVLLHKLWDPSFSSLGSLRGTESCSSRRPVSDTMAACLAFVLSTR